MSGDVQPRKRKDKRKRKEGGSLGNINDVIGGKSVERDESPVRSSHGGHGSEATDVRENIHVHHDHGVGGNLWVKIIFFALFSVLLALVGVVFFESRGSTDVDLPSIEESRFADYFTGWLDDASDDHGHDDPSEAASEEDHNEHEESHDDDDGGEDEHSQAEEDEHESDEDLAEEREEADPTDEEDDDNDEDVQEESNNDTDEEGESEEMKFEDDDEEEEKEASTEDEDDDEEASVEYVADDEDITAEDSANDEDMNSNENTSGNNDVDDDDNEVDDEEEDYDLTQEDSEEEQIIKKERSKVKPEDSLEKGEEEDSGVEEEDDEEEVEKDDNLKRNVGSHQDASDSEEDPKEASHMSEEAEEIEESDEALKEEEEAVKKEKLNLLDDDDGGEKSKTGKLSKKEERALQRKLKKLLQEKVKETIAEEGEDSGDGKGNEDDDEENAATGGVAVKLGVGVAMVIVAHMVIVRKWRELNSASADAIIEEVARQEEVAVDEGNEPEQELIFRRQTLIEENLDFPVGEESEKYEYSDDEGTQEIIKPKTIQDIKVERLDPNNYYTKEELGDSDELEEEEELGEEEEEYEVEEEEEEYEQEESQTPSELGEDEEELEGEEEEDEEDSQWQKPPVPPPRRGPQGVDNQDDVHESSEAEILTQEFQDTESERSTNESEQPDNDESAQEASTEQEQAVSQEDDVKFSEDDDWLFRQELDLAEDQLINNPQSALTAFMTILTRGPRSIRALVGKARSLDSLAEQQRNNQLLAKAIESYQMLLTQYEHRLNDSLFREVADRCINRMRFAGKLSQAVSVHNALITRFPDDPTPRNTLAVSYLILNQVKQAKLLLKETLAKWPDNGFAKAHLGFILKTSDGNLEEGAQLLAEGIRSEEPGVVDGRFFFHLGDALNRLGRGDEAMAIYELGKKKGLFLSKYQRSLYNVDRLQGRPWWTHQQTTYVDFFKSLERNWKKIRDEGLSLLNAKNVQLFKDEAESLKDTGDWKQLDLYSRGRKQQGCNHAPTTCSLISAFLPAASCSRGQAKFSVMFPGTHVWPHCGPTNCRLRSHLGLVVPPNTFIRVAEEIRSWEEGKVFVFDDSFEHEVWHNGTSPRLVLIVDVWHPELTISERKTLTPI